MIQYLSRFNRFKIVEKMRTLNKKKIVQGNMYAQHKMNKDRMESI